MAPPTFPPDTPACLKIRHSRMLSSNDMLRGLYILSQLPGHVRLDMGTQVVLFSPEKTDASPLRFVSCPRTTDHIIFVMRSSSRRSPENEPWVVVRVAVSHPPPPATRSLHGTPAPEEAAIQVGGLELYDFDIAKNSWSSSEWRTWKAGLWSAHLHGWFAGQGWDLSHHQTAAGPQFRRRNNVLATCYRSGPACLELVWLLLQQQPGDRLASLLSAATVSSAIEEAWYQRFRELESPTLEQEDQAWESLEAMYEV